jgi:F0F1-type ATP synthase assembly protein I
MIPRSKFARSQKLTIATGMLALVAVLVVLQLWLFTASMNAYLGGDVAALPPAAAVSLACFGLNVGLLRYLYGLER